MSKSTLQMHGQPEFCRFSERYDTGPRGEAVERGLPVLPRPLPGDERANVREDAYPDSPMPWRVNAPMVLRAVLAQKGLADLHPTVELMIGLLESLVDRAARLKDTWLDALLCRLTLVKRANPDSEEYDPAAVTRCMEAAVAAGPDAPAMRAPTLAFKDNNTPTVPGWYMGIYPRGLTTPNLYEISIVSGNLHARKVWATTGHWLANFGDTVIWTDRIIFDVPADSREACKNLFRV